MATPLLPAMKQRDQQPPATTADPVKEIEEYVDISTYKKKPRGYFIQSMEASLKSELYPEWHRFFNTLANVYWGANIRCQRQKDAAK